MLYRYYTLRIHIDPSLSRSGALSRLRILGSEPSFKSIRADSSFLSTCDLWGKSTVSTVTVYTVYSKFRIRVLGVLS